MSDLVVQ